MKIRYKYSLYISLFGLVIIILLLIGYFLYNRNLIINNELKNIQITSNEISKTLSSRIKEKINISKTLASAPILTNALIKSNKEFSNLSYQERIGVINKLNKKWMSIEDASDPFIKTFTDNYVSNFLKKQQNIIPGEYGEIFITNKYGSIIATTGKLTTLKHAHKYWWKGAYNNGTGKIYLDDRGFDISVQGYVLGIVVPLVYKHEIIGILKCNFNIASLLSSIINQPSLQKGQKLIIARTGGQIIAERSAKSFLSKTLSDIIANVLITKKTFKGIVDEKKENILVSVSPIKLTLGSDNITFGGNSKSIDQYKGNNDESWSIVVYITLRKVLTQTGFIKIFILFAIVFLILIIFIAYVLARQLTNPITQISDAAKKIGQGNFDTKINVKANDEISTLAVNLNEMAINLKKITASKTDLEKVVQERTKAQDALKKEKTAVDKAKMELERSNKELEQFAYVVSHDLQEPLRMVSSFLQLLVMEHEDKLDDEAKSYINFAVDGAKRMNRLIHDLLAFSRLGTKGKPFKMIDMSIVMKTVLLNLEASIEESKANINCKIIPDQIFGDETQLVQLFQNLIGNAIKFRAKDRKPEISISVTSSNNSWNISVKDNGIGINKEFFERIFVIFQRLNSRKNYEGTGIGLAICKKIVERHKGSIDIQSEEGKGTEFIIKLPNSGQ